MWVLSLIFLLHLNISCRLHPLSTSVSQIEKDLLRTMPTNACFNSLTSVGVPRLRRVLRGLAWLYPDIGYCQGTGMVRTPTYRCWWHHKQLHYISQLSQRINRHFKFIGYAHLLSSSLHFGSSSLFLFPSLFITQGGFLSIALSGGGGRVMDDVCSDWRPPTTIILLLHPTGCPNRPEGSPPAHCSVPASPWPPIAGAWHR